MRSIRSAVFCLATGLFVFSPALAEDSLGNSVIDQRFEALEASISVIDQRFEALEARVSDLESENAALKDLLYGVSRMIDPNTGQDTLRFSSMNVQIVNGNGTTFNNSNGTGNLIVGYNEELPRS